MEKYNAFAPGEMGGGGEYETQTGFGWTNGIALYFLQNYGWNSSLTMSKGSSLKMLGEVSGSKTLKLAERPASRIVNQTSIAG